MFNSAWNRSRYISDRSRCRRWNHELLVDFVPSGISHHTNAQTFVTESTPKLAHLLNVTEGLPIPDPIQTFGNPQKTAAQAEKLALLYPAMPHDVMIQVVECYLKLWTASRSSHATLFATGFVENS